ncbi:MAG TPA: hypothetical protein VLC48_11510 [Gemmatimonadota bacterium]|nr:hypothetical protein [Gemmatimonadota bacterium]
MKRLIPFLCLALVAVACEMDAPTVPEDDLQLGVDCDDPKFEEHPKCGGGGETDAYDAIPLGEARSLSWAADLSERTAGVTLVTGYTEGSSGDPIATLWTVTDGAAVKATLPQRSGRGPSAAPGISDDGSLIVGYDAESMGGAGNAHFVGTEPIMWKAPFVSADPLTLPALHNDGGFARDVNNSGTIVGTSFDRYYHTRATVWDGYSGTVNRMLASFDESGSSEAFSVNNDGYVVGFGTTANANYPPWHAMLWAPDGTKCDLHVQSGWSDDIKTDAVGISDDLGDGTILIVGGGNSGSAVWQGDPTDCSSFQVLPMPSDVEFHGVSANHEAVGKTTSGKPHPVYFDLISSTLIAAGDKPGVANEINLAGEIVGWVDSKGSEIATLWIPRQ